MALVSILLFWHWYADPNLPFWVSFLFIIPQIIYDLNAFHAVSCLFIGCEGSPAYHINIMNLSVSLATWPFLTYANGRWPSWMLGIDNISHLPLFGVIQYCVTIVFSPSSARHLFLWNCSAIISTRIFVLWVALVLDLWSACYAGADTYYSETSAFKLLLIEWRHPLRSYGDRGYYLALPCHDIWYWLSIVHLWVMNLRGSPYLLLDVPPLHAIHVGLGLSDDSSMLPWLWIGVLPYFHATLAYHPYCFDLLVDASSTHIHHIFCRRDPTFTLNHVPCCWWWLYCFLWR